MSARPASAPALPSERNSLLAEIFDSGLMPQVKYQVLNAAGTDILVGRLKVDTPTPSGHAFILRRYDTNAVSLTTIFRAAFPNSDQEAEKREMQWVKDTYDLSGNNGSSRDPASAPRLAGTWVKPTDALKLGEQYAIRELIQILVDAQPDPGANYRRSGKNKDKDSANTEATPSRSQPTPSSPNPPAAKRRKESSPAPPPAMVVSPRRSTRTKSPKPASQTMPSITSVVKASSKKTSRRAEPDVSANSDETAVEDDGGAAAVEDSATSALRDQDIAEQRKLISDLKQQRELARAEAVTTKRAREEDDKSVALEIREPQIGERAIATNSRITARTRSAAWGVVAFAFGVGLTASFLPNFF
uniref:APSES transcription factor n=1 Tax=Mycena chlorophos TaxID=658473 RepID=A0ABQ0MCI1_MYCCL|nr:APSES transcription factor [Mycena chlorophos]